ncbi:class III lanthionine synthetase LanKC [Actinokineospora bangkokensis]|uniref:Protein kinase domain-containing protein n=1 Tax=Actinokineospora bangkokensis TaxID=1193682 RepID=A0A1Q9LM05_9PSEU|nr:class III lanthionine synthetase LanKC [Actinokineospora bangkokensis]OLR93039.1 hypothetical protein BJP25_18990 [Actinokineospora bangkokensis]
MRDATARRYGEFCHADPVFYDRVDLDDLAVVAPLPAGWVERRSVDWRFLLPEGAALPDQGWKVHVSATRENLRRVLAAVHRYCAHHGTAFKHLRSETAHLVRNGKYADRSASGKLVAVYPRDDAHLAHVLARLGDELAGEAGPTVLSDLRHGAGPLHVRYGAFAPRWVEQGGRRVPAIQAPDGRLVPDERGTGFHPPEWVAVPDCLSADLAARERRTEFPYPVERALHFSNGGGVYLARRGGTRVVLKEARPHSGLDRDGTDAVTRLDREEAALRALSGVDGVPELLERFQVWEHHYLAVEHLPGRPFSQWVAAHHPLTREASPDDVADYTRRALAVLDRVADIAAAVHARGIVHGDLHPRNILVDDTGAVGLVDFEQAGDGTRPAGLGAPGFHALEDPDGHALAVLRLWAFLPLAPVLDLAPALLDRHLAAVGARFPLPAGYLSGIRRALAPPPEPAPFVPGDLATAVLASATPHRRDRLFPGDPAQFATAGLTLDHGAAGVLHALDLAGAGRHPEHERWLVDAVRRTPPTRPGLYDGAHGIAHVLHRFGHRDLADDLVDRAARATTDDPGLHSGLAGIGLNLLHLGHDPLPTATRLLDVLDRAGERAADGPAGLGHGWAGPALLFTRLFERTGDRAWLDFAATALDRDLARCTPGPGGSLQVRDGTRALPYLWTGSAGIALVVRELARHLPAFAAALPGLLAACRPEMVVHPGLFDGRAGLLAALAIAGGPVDRHVDALGWHAVPFAGGAAFPGTRLLRLSMDLATGTAGVLLAVACALDPTRPFLPFLTEPAPARPVLTDQR